jgi:Protein of unknown function DUF262
MVNRLVLDAMIYRSDFWQKGGIQGNSGTTASAKPASSITFENLKSDSTITLSLRKPDFQRETNQWSVGQAMNFIQSFLDGELVPSIILWQSPDGLIFVIDGAHRLSALRAWIEDDYGDRARSIAFFGGEIPLEQKKLAKSMRSRVEREIGSYQSLRDKISARASDPDIKYVDVINRRLTNLNTRQLELQWVGGDAGVAETSFFKINTQGTPLDKIEEELLRYRDRAPAIAARSIVRAATGHKYWSKFDDNTKKEIERISGEINTLLFQPELQNPIKTLQLPIGGSSSNLDALSLLIRFLSITEGTQTQRRIVIKDTLADETGQKTISALKLVVDLVSRITGNSAPSLGLHPAIYFYSDNGKYLAEMFLGVSYLFKGKILNNETIFFKRFIEARSKIEAFLIANKAIISQMLVQIGSKSRTERVSAMFQRWVDDVAQDKELSIKATAEAANLKGEIVALQEKAVSQNFTDSGKSAAFLNVALKSAIKCPICDGYLEPAMSVSYDHKIRKQDGGTGDSENAQLSHAFCNTGIKN